MTSSPLLRTSWPVSGRAPVIVCEGLDGVGKSTLSRTLATALGARWATTPGEALRGVRDAFEDGFRNSRTARSIAYAATVVNEGTQAQAVVKGGTPVVFDRYWLSTLVYAPDAARDALAGIERHVPPADITLYVWAPEEVRAARLHARGLTAEDERSLATGRGLDRAFRQHRRHRVCGAFHVIDARRSPADMVGQALFAILGAGIARGAHRLSPGLMPASLALR
jgi:dTMP kinase